MNQTTNDAAAFTAAVHVRDDGTVAVTYYDFRNDHNGDATLDTDYWMVHSHDGGKTWDPSEARLTPRSFDMRTAPFAVGYFTGDYEGLDNAGNAFTPLFVIANNGNRPTGRTCCSAPPADPERPRRPCVRTLGLARPAGHGC